MQNDNEKFKIIYAKDLGVSQEVTLVREKESLRWLLVFAENIPHEVGMRIRLTGRGSRAEVMIAYCGRQRDETSMDITFVHDAQDTYGRVIVKAALFDESRFVLKGMLEITPRAKGADSYLLANGLLVSGQARAEIYPQLEIQTDEVRASHGSSVGRIDQKQLFYLQSRGVPRDEAEKIVLSGFFRDVTKDIPARYAAKFFQTIEGV